MSINIYLADLNRPFDAKSMVEILGVYYQSIMGNNAPLPLEVRDTVVAGLLSQSNHRVFLAVSNETENMGPGQAIGMAVCFENFSTFRAKPLINVHDLAVRPEFQGRGIGQSLLEKVIAYAVENHHCAVTLEVRKDNANALKLYRKLGFTGIEKDAGDESMLFGKLIL